MSKPDATTRTLQQYMIRHQEQIGNALPSHLDAKNMIRMAMTEVSLNKELHGCDPRSFFGAVIECSQLGLAIGKTLGQAYLVPFNNRRTQTKTINVIVGYKGLISLARRSGNLLEITAHTVFVDDTFDYVKGDDEKIIHIPKEVDTPDDDRIVRAYYSIALLSGGGKQRSVWTAAEIDQHKKRIPAAQNSRSVWNSPIAHDRWEMGKKTCIRAVTKYIDLSAEYLRAGALNDRSDMNKDQNLGSHVLVGEFEEVEELGEIESPSESQPKTSRSQQLKQDLQTATQEDVDPVKPETSAGTAPKSEYDIALAAAVRKVHSSRSTKTLKEYTDAALSAFPDQEETINAAQRKRFETLTKTE